MSHAPKQVDAFKTPKLAERERYERATETERKTLPTPLSNGSVNKRLKVLAMILMTRSSTDCTPARTPFGGDC